MDPYERVLAEPGSIAARQALAAHWKANGDPRGRLIEVWLGDREARREGRVAMFERLRDNIDTALRQYAKAWAGELAEYANEDSYHLGLVAEVWVPGEKFASVAKKLFQLAPVQHVNITAQLGSLAEILGCSELRKLTSFSISNHGANVADRGANAVAGCAHLSGLRWLGLAYDEITQAGVEALAASPFLAKLAYLSLDGNPCNPIPRVSDYDGFYQVSRPALAEQLERQYGPRPWLAEPKDPKNWPPMSRELGITS